MRLGERMGANTQIEWTDAVWNPVTGCTKVSDGCRNCYAESMAHRFWGERPFTDVRCHPERLMRPLRWTKPRRVFVNSMSDLFHEDVSHDFIFHVFRIMARCQTHTFQVLTKRPDRMLDFCRRIRYIDPGFNGHAFGTCSYWPNDPVNYPTETRPLPNVWLGVSCEDQKTADERIPILLQTPSAVRWVSAEPVLGPIQITPYLEPVILHKSDGGKGYRAGRKVLEPALNWVVVGGESGPHARECRIDWIRSLVHQCREAGIPVFVKQLGSQPRSGLTNHMVYITDAKGGEPSEWPAELRRREWPR